MILAAGFRFTRASDILDDLGDDPSDFGILL
jgi:hypothetical protein